MQQETAKTQQRRIVALDGLRGLATIIVLLSHYFGEVQNGFAPFMAGWIAVNVFFVMSGFLVGSLILDKEDCRNFLQVFYIRRICRTVPVYFACVIIVYLFISLLGEVHWIDADVQFPLWSYLSFTQNFFMIQSGSTGAHWLAPTWTLVVEEQFYLLVPTLFILVPRRYLIHTLTAIILSAIGVRWAIIQFAPDFQMARFVLLPARADEIASGLLLAVILKSDKIDWIRHKQKIRILPMLPLVTLLCFVVIDRVYNIRIGEIIRPTLISIFSATYILVLVLGFEEANKFHSKFLCFFGSTSYSIYLTHLLVLGLLHGFVFGKVPDVASIPQIALTIAALPIAVFVGWVLTKIFEEPITAWGRSWKWSEQTLPLQPHQPPASA